MRIIQQYRKLKQQDRYMMMRYILVFSICIMVHMMLVIMFTIIDRPVLVGLNTVSILFYFVEFVRLGYQRIGIVDLTLFYLDTVVHACICNLEVGWNYGFSLYGLMAIPVTFYISSQEKRIPCPIVGSVLLSVLNVAAMMTTSLISYFRAPYDVAPATVTIFCINMIACAVALMFYTHQFLLDIKHAESGLAYLAQYDELTGLRNRHNMDKDLRAMEGKQYCIAIGDIDDFKKVNDVYGHTNGDVVLSTVATMLKSSLCDTDIVCRWGGEEFLLVICKPLDFTEKIIESIRKKIEDTGIRISDSTLNITMTFGIADSLEAENVDKLLVIADKRLYYGKNHGKNQVVTSMNE